MTPGPLGCAHSGAIMRHPVKIGQTLRGLPRPISRAETLSIGVSSAGSQVLFIRTELHLHDMRARD